MFKLNASLCGVLVALSMYANGVAQLTSPASCGVPPTINSKAKVPVIIDTDVAEDDWIAILYLLSRDDIDIKAITVVGTGETEITPGLNHVGNLTVLAGKPHIPIYSSPDRKTVVDYSSSHSFPIAWQQGVNSGHDIPELNSNTYQQANISKQPAADAIANIIKNSKSHPVNIVALGPLTNIYNALKQMKNEDISNIGNIYIMAGAYQIMGNLGKYSNPCYIDNNLAEWNAFADPVALDEAFSKLDNAFSISFSMLL